MLVEWIYGLFSIFSRFFFYLHQRQITCQIDGFFLSNGGGIYGDGVCVCIYIFIYANELYVCVCVCVVMRYPVVSQYFFNHLSFFTRIFSIVIFICCVCDFYISAQFFLVSIWLFIVVIYVYCRYLCVFVV